MAISRAEVVDYLANMTVLELSQLIKDLEEKFGVSATATGAAADTPNFSSRSLMSSESSNTVMLARVSMSS